MLEERVTTKAQLMAAMERSWHALTGALERLSEAEMTTLEDAQGWTVKDHIVHMMAWERSVLCFLRGRPRYHCLGVEERLYLEGDEDRINDAIYREHRALPLDEVLEQFGATHQQLLEILHPLDDAALQKRYREYLPDEPGEGDGPPAINVIYGNSVHHFKEHLAWIDQLLGRSASPGA